MENSSLKGINQDLLSKKSINYNAKRRRIKSDLASDMTSCNHRTSEKKKTGPDASRIVSTLQEVSAFLPNLNLLAQLDLPRVAGAALSSAIFS